MSSIGSVLSQLTSGFLTETAIPEEFLYNQDIINAIQKYNWAIMASNTVGWISLKRIRNYYS
jgi:hypothetical protein